MRKFLFFSFITSALVLGIAGDCKKGSGGGGGGGTNEAPLVVTLNPPVNSNQPAAPQTDFPLTVSITSTMPPQGVTIDVNVKKDGSADPAFFTINQNTSGAVSNFTITNTPVSVVCITTVTVTSRSTATNTWTGTYRYSRKP
jgi:hypothetical protein